MAFENRRTIKIAWGDCDAAGIVFYPKYFEMFDECTTELFAEAGFHMRESAERSDFVGWPMIETSANFKKSSRYGDHISIVSRITSWRNTSFFVEHTVLRGEELCIVAKEHRVWAVRGEDGQLRAARAPDEIITKMCAETAA